MLLVLLPADTPALTVGAADTIRAVWLADLHPDRVRAGTAGRFVFVPGSSADEIDGGVLVEDAGPPGVLRTVHFAAGETDEGLDGASPIVAPTARCSSASTRRRPDLPLPSLPLAARRTPAASAPHPPRRLAPWRGVSREEMPLRLCGLVKSLWVG
jgi:hypothetical protein